MLVLITLIIEYPLISTDISTSLKLSILIRPFFFEVASGSSPSSSHYANNYCNIYITSIGSAPDISESSASSIGMLRPDIKTFSVVVVLKYNLLLLL